MRIVPRHAEAVAIEATPSAHADHREGMPYRSGAAVGHITGTPCGEAVYRAADRVETKSALGFCGRYTTSPVRRRTQRLLDTATTSTLEACALSSTGAAALDWKDRRIDACV